VSSARAAGLAGFKLDLGHADIARAMISEFPAQLRP
jgi:ATP phosphoribosyltransferase regulatory subunit HisZ